MPLGCNIWKWESFDKKASLYSSSGLLIVVLFIESFLLGLMKLPLGAWEEQNGEEVSAIYPDQTMWCYDRGLMIWYYIDAYTRIVDINTFKLRKVNQLCCLSLKPGIKWYCLMPNWCPRSGRVPSLSSLILGKKIFPLLCASIIFILILRNLEHFRSKIHFCKKLLLLCYLLHILPRKFFLLFYIFLI